MLPTEDKLVGWLCAMRLNWREDQHMFLPTGIADEFVRRGWMTRDEDPDWDGLHNAHLTDLGCQVSDLNGPEYGIEVLEVDSAD